MAATRSGSSRGRTPEFQLIDSLRRQFDGVEGLGLEVGIGDDAAVLRSPGRLVWTVDASVEGVHFRREWLAWFDVGYRSFQAAVSDVAAMGGVPVAALSALVVPKELSPADLRALGRGQASAAREVGCPVVGGNVSGGREVSVTTTVLGRVRRPVLRSGACVGDELWLFGDLGLARAGLELLQRGVRRGARQSPRGRCLQSWRRPRARVDCNVALGRARAAIDVSDGLMADAGHVARASRVRLVVHEALLRPALAGALLTVAQELGLDPLELALYGGEDYALLGTGPRRRRPTGARVIGQVEAGAGVWLQRLDGNRSLANPGFDHLTSG